MRRFIAVALAGATLAGCSSFSDAFKPAPTMIPLQLESVPPGADAVTSLGPGCKTPCSVSVPAPEGGFAVTFNLPKFQPETVQVQVTRNPGDFASPASTVIDPNPVVAELKPAGPPPRAARKPLRPKKPKKPKTAAAPAAAAPADSNTPFPDPNAPPATR